MSRANDAAGDEEPEDDEQRSRPAGRGRHDGGGGTSNETSISPASAAFRSVIFASRIRSRLTICSRTGSGFCDGWVVAEAGQLLGDRDRLAVALEPLLGVRPARRSAARRGGPSREANAARRGSTSVSVRRSRAPDERVAVALELGEGELALLHRGLGPLRRASVATFRRPGFFSPFVLSP